MSKHVLSTFAGIIILITLLSCRKEGIPRENHFLINGEDILIDTALIILRYGEAIPGLHDFRIAFYSEGAHFYKDQGGFDSIVYDDNTHKVYFWLNMPDGTHGFSGMYYFSRDSAYHFEQSAYLNSRTGIGINYEADSGWVSISEKKEIYEVDFEFFRYGDDTWPENIDLRGKYKGEIVVRYDKE